VVRVSKAAKVSKKSARAALHGLGTHSKSGRLTKRYA